MAILICSFAIEFSCMIVFLEFDLFADLVLFDLFNYLFLVARIFDFVFNHLNFEEFFMRNFPKYFIYLECFANKIYY